MAPTSAKRVIKILRNLTLDIRLGGLYGVGYQPHSPSSSAHEVAATNYTALPLIFDGLVGPDDVLVDVGCGRGRVIRWWLHQGYSNKIIGIELDKKTALYARRKLKKWNNVEIVHGDVLTNIPQDGTIFYLYNPFNREMTEKVKVRIVDLFARKKSVKLLYYNSRYVDVFKDDPNWAVRELDFRDSTNSQSSLLHKLAIIELQSSSSDK